MSDLAGRQSATNAITASSGTDRSTNLPALRLFWVAHLMVTLVLFVFIARQYLGYGLTQDPDPDGYVSYAAYLEQHGTLMTPMRRLPGYPLFLVLSSRIFGGDYHHSVFYAQLGILLALGAILHMWLLRRFGHVAALAYTSILAAPSFLVAQSAVMLSDFLYAALSLPTVYALHCWLLTNERERWHLSLPVIAAVFFILYNLRPTTSVFMMLFLAAVAATVAVRAWQWKRGGAVSARSLWPLVFRTAACMVLVTVVSVLVYWFIDTGSNSYNLMALRNRVVYVTPPAGDSEHERAIETFRARVEQDTGQPIESLPWRLRADTPDSTDVDAVWLARLRAHPGAYVASVFNALRWTHYLLLRNVVPYAPDVSFIFNYPPLENTYESRIFRTTGLLTHEGFWVMALKFVGTWMLLVVGARELYRVQPVFVSAFVLLFFFYWVFLAAVVNPEGRYLLPFVVPVYVAEAVGLSRIAHWFVAGDRTSFRSGEVSV